MDTKNIRSVVYGILEILQTPEIVNLIDTGHEFNIEISKPVAQVQTSIEDIQNSDCKLQTQNISEKDMKKKLGNKYLSYRKYRNEILNGICRQISLDDHTQKYYEERCYVLAQNSSDIWIVTIWNQCSENLIPWIIDYDQSYDYYEKIYGNQIRETGSLSNSKNDDHIKIKYEIYNQLNADLISNENVAIKEITRILKKIDRTYQNIFDSKN